MAAGSGIDITHLRVDGDSVQHDLLYQRRTDIVETDVVRPPPEETTAVGAACGVGPATDGFDSLTGVPEAVVVDRRFDISMDGDRVTDRYERWSAAVDRAKDWAREDA